MTFPLPVLQVESARISHHSLNLSDRLAQFTYTEEILRRINGLTNWLSNSPALLEELTEPAPLPSAPPYQTLFLGHALNQTSDITESLRKSFSLIQPGGFLICRLETSEQRKNRLFGLSPSGLAYLWYVVDYLLHRVAPRFSLTRRLYKQFFPTERVLSRAEALGRIIHAGYTLTSTLDTGDQLYIKAQKITTELVQRPPSPEGILLTMWRVGQSGRPFRVYKIRTMHPYSEYLQEYMHQLNGLEAGGKFKDDFRIIAPGRFMRKYWLDEIPMFINLLKGDIKLVGVRPLSSQYFNLYPEAAKQERIRHKPGLFPPYYADLPQTFDEIVDSELRYLRAYSQAPLRTDGRYLLKILYNIIWKRARSK
ncbi:hypothetical protein GCM10023189_27860 [Nibrella saemangeumensis]|uniref:Bacterial sugar transferase domain-containing protein n=1 Tax=Nibrella saemangeumensis TaxID=1084526 RepID=A0ABP8N0G8_9BACT